VTQTYKKAGEKRCLSCKILGSLHFIPIKQKPCTFGGWKGFFVENHRQLKSMKKLDAAQYVFECMKLEKESA